MKSWTSSLAALAAALATTAAFPAYAQDAAQAGRQDAPQDGGEPDDLEGEGTSEIVVTGRSLRGQIDSPEAPIIELDSEDIAAYGASSIADLVEQLAPQTTSGRGRGDGGRPVFLVNGLRVSSFREFRSYPPEAIEKVEVLPEEVAQRYGFPPDRRVINFIMKENYSSREVELEIEAPDRGGFSSREMELTYLKLNADSRYNVNLEYNDNSLLTEAERDIIQTPGSLSSFGSDPDPAEFRSLRGESRDFEATGNWTSRLGEGASVLSLNGTYERSESRSLSGLNTVTLTDPMGDTARRTFGADNPLARRGRSDTLSFGGAVNTVLNEWDTALTIDAVRSENETEIDRRVDTDGLVADAAAGVFALDAPIPGLTDPGIDIARSRTNNVASKATFRGNPLFLPAGEVSTTFDLGADWQSIDSQDTRTVDQERLTRSRFSSGVDVTIPIAERDYAWGAIGDLSLNLGAGIEEISDFGTLGDYSAGLTWGPLERVTLGATYISAEAAPSLNQLGAPQVETLNVPVFDFVTGDTVLATIVTGGNPNLVEESQSDWKFSANWEPWFWDDARLNVEYFDNSSQDVSSSFPFLTPEIEAAFPDRVTRNAFGELQTLDRRPITFARQDSSRLAVGLTLRGSFGQAAPQGEAAEGASQQGRPQGGRPQGAGRGPGGGGPPGMTEEQREQFMAFRQRLCADDGMAYLEQVVAASQGDEAALAAMGEDFDPEQVDRLLSRFRGEDGSIDMERLTQFRTMICSSEASGSGNSGGGGRRGGGGGVGGFGDDGRGRYFANLTYTRELSNTVLIADGGPELDLLNGDALTGGGTTRDSASLEAGAFRDGWGVRLSGRYSGRSTILGTGAPGSTDLLFGDLATFDVRLFADLGEIIDDDGIWKGARVSLRADNIFDTRREVVDQDGNTPLAYQPFLIDPIGRFLGVEFRKLF